MKIFQKEPVVFKFGGKYSNLIPLKDDNFLLLLDQVAFIYNISSNSTKQIPNLHVTSENCSFTENGVIWTTYGRNGLPRRNLYSTDYETFEQIDCITFGSSNDYLQVIQVGEYIILLCINAGFSIEQVKYQVVKAKGKLIEQKDDYHKFNFLKRQYECSDNYKLVVLNKQVLIHYYNHINVHDIDEDEKLELVNILEYEDDTVIQDIFPLGTEELGIFYERKKSYFYKIIHLATEKVTVDEIEIKGNVFPISKQEMFIYDGSDVIYSVSNEKFDGMSFEEKILKILFNGKYVTFVTKSQMYSFPYSQ